MNVKKSDHYATLGLHSTCSATQIRMAFRALAKQHHPDVNPDSSDAMARIQALNAAYETLGDVARRQAYDEACARAERTPVPPRARVAASTITQEVRLSLADFLRGASLAISVNDPAAAGAREWLTLVIPPGTAPGTRFRLRRAPPFEHGFVVVRVKARPDPRFSTRGSDLRCALKISAQRAMHGGAESVRNVLGQALRIHLLPGISRGEIIRIPGEGLPRVRGGRGDLLVRITYRVDVRITRAVVR